MFQWEEKYEMGIDFIDLQHKMLFNIANKAYELMKNYIYLDKYDRITNIINEFKAYTVYHFSAEEEYLKVIDYKDFKKHKAEHDNFIEKFNSIDFRYMDQRQDQYILNILEFIYKWINNHILVEDKQYLKQGDISEKI
jgi:hemerythrin